MGEGVSFANETAPFSQQRRLLTRFAEGVTLRVHRRPSTMGAIKIALAFVALQLHGARGFQRPVVPRELPSPSSPLRVASTAWATSNDGVGKSHLRQL